jgi:hypothetical protein
MPDPSSFRDSTEIVLPSEELDGLRSDLESEFTVTVFALNGDSPGEAEYVRIIGSPVVIKEVSEYLTRHGVSLP